MRAGGCASGLCSLWMVVALSGCSCGDDDDDTTGPPPGCPPFPLFIRIAQDPALGRIHEPVTLRFRVEDVDGNAVPDDHYAFEASVSYADVRDPLAEVEPGVYSMTVLPTTVGGTTVGSSAVADGNECPVSGGPPYRIAVDGGEAVELLLTEPAVRMVPGERRRIAAVALGAALPFEGSLNPVAVYSADAVRWSTADGAIASVDERGVITAVAAGETTLTALAGAASTSIPLSVVDGDVGPPPFGTTELPSRLLPDSYSVSAPSAYTPSNDQWRRSGRRMVLDGRGWPAVFASPRSVAGVAAGLGANLPLLYSWSGTGFSSELLPRPLWEKGGGQVAVDGTGRLWVTYLNGNTGHESPFVIADRDFDAAASDLRERPLDVRSELGDPALWESEFADPIRALPAGGFPAPRVQARAMLGLPEGGVWVAYGVAQVVEELGPDQRRCERILRLARVTPEAIEAEDVERLSFEVGCDIAPLAPDQNPFGPFSVGLGLPGQPDGKPTIVATAGVTNPLNFAWGTWLIRFDWDGARWIRTDLEPFLGPAEDWTFAPTVAVLPEPTEAGEPRFLVRANRLPDPIEGPANDFIWASPSLLPGLGATELVAVASPTLDAPGFQDRDQMNALPAGDGVWLSAEALGQTTHLTTRGALRLGDDARPYLFGDPRGLGPVRAVSFAASDAGSLHFLVEPQQNDQPQLYARVPVPPRVEDEAPRDEGRRLGDEPLTGYVETPLSATEDGTRYLQLFERPGDPDGERRLMRSSDGAPWQEVYSFGTEEAGYAPAFLAAPREVGGSLYGAREWGPTLLGQGNYRAEVLRSDDGGASWTSLHDFEAPGTVTAFLPLPDGGAFLVVQADLLVEGDFFAGYRVLHTPDVDGDAFVEVGAQPAAMPLTSRVLAEGPSPFVALLPDGDGALLVASIFHNPTQTWGSVVQRWSAGGVLLEEVMADRDRSIAPASAALAPDGALLVVDSLLGATYDMGLLRSEDLLATAERAELGPDLPGFIVQPLIPEVFVPSGFGPLALLETGEVVWGGTRPIGQDQMRVYLRVSRDGGRTFDDPVEPYPQGGRGQMLGALAPDPEGGVTVLLGDNGGLTAPLLAVDPRDFLELRVQP